MANEGTAEPVRSVVQVIRTPRGEELVVVPKAMWVEILRALSRTDAADAASGAPEALPSDPDEPRSVVETLRNLEDAFDALLEDSQAARAVERDRRDLAEGRESVVPAELADRILAGENPVRVWREHLGLSQVQLAAAAGVGQGYVSDIEKGRRRGSVEVLSRLARRLGVSVEDLLPIEPEAPSGPEHAKRRRMAGRAGPES